MSVNSPLVLIAVADFYVWLSGAEAKIEDVFVSGPKKFLISSLLIIQGVLHQNSCLAWNTVLCFWKLIQFFHH